MQDFTLYEIKNRDKFFPNQPILKKKKTTCVDIKCNYIDSYNPLTQLTRSLYIFIKCKSRNQNDTLRLIRGNWIKSIAA